MKNLKPSFSLILLSFLFCSTCKEKKEAIKPNLSAMIEKQITFSPKTHSLDNNDNFSPDERFLCYDTRGMVFNNNLANCKSIEKVEIATGEETLLWSPPSESGENGAPGVAAVSYHPTENKVIFIHGPLLEEVKTRGYYSIKNRSAVIVSGDKKRTLTKVDLRDIQTERPTTPGAQRGGTHRHEYSRDGSRIGFTYDDFIQQDYGRTIGYMEAHENAPKGYTHYFTVLLKPAKKGSSKPGEIEKAYGDSWIDSNGTIRAFIGQVRAKNGIDYENSLFVAEVPKGIDITTAFSGDKDTYPTPPNGVIIRRLTHSKSDAGIVRGAYSGEKIAYLSNDKNGIKQVFVIPTDGDDKNSDPQKRPRQISNYKSDAGSIRWHPSDNWIFSISDGKIYAHNLKQEKMIVLTPNNDLVRNNLVIAPSGDQLAYNAKIKIKDATLLIDGQIKSEFDQIFILKLINL